MLEALLHSDNSFVTLTYDDQHLPAGGTLVPKDAQDWLKRLRKQLSFPIRYYLVGEYGDETFRPHYHAALFGYPVCRRGGTSKVNSVGDCCDVCAQIRDSWANGQIKSGTLEASSAQYIAGYVTKKMTSKDDPRLGGRHPEFARMSLRPGIGADALHEVASTLMEFDLAESQGDVPSALRHGGRVLPLGRYLRRRLRKLVGLDESAPQATIDAMAEELQDLYASARDGSASSLVTKTIFKNLIIDAGDQAVRNMEGRAKIRKQRRSL